ncbi:MAG: hypothetical protein ABIJ45_15215 [Candidatus Zixiibacteriota bacterium]
MSEKRDYSRQFQILKDIAVSSTEGGSAESTARLALQKTADLIGLTAGALILWTDNYKPILSVNYHKSGEEKELLDDLEKNLFADMRLNRKMVSAYVTFGGERPMTGFTLPIKKEKEILGAVIGIQPGEESLVKEDEFLEALSASLTVAILISRMDERLNRERYEAVMATATAVNHGINNSLQAALGIVQLLPKDLPDLDERMMKKLKAIEESVLAITKITHKLMHLKEVKYTDYIDGTKMLDLPDDTD